MFVEYEQYTLLLVLDFNKLIYDQWIMIKLYNTNNNTTNKKK